MSQVPGDICPLITSLDVICECLHTDIWVMEERKRTELRSGNPSTEPCNLLRSKAHSSAFYWPIECLLVVLPSRVLGNDKLLKWVMKHVFHLRQTLSGFDPLQLFAWSTINYGFVFVFVPEGVQCVALMQCIIYCSLYCIYLGSKLCFCIFI